MTDLLPSEALMEKVRNGADSTFYGRITRIYFHSDVCLMRLIRNGIPFRAVVKRNVTKNYDEIIGNLKLGTLICGIYKTQVVKNKEELLFIQILIVHENFLTDLETGLKEESPFNVSDKKKYYHSFLCSDDICSFNIQARSSLLWGLRQFLHENNYVECTTPVMGRFFHGGGAQAFVTHMRDSDRDMYLRITSEIALKLIIGGSFEKVFEIGYSFRNGSVRNKYETPFYAAEIYSTLIEEQDNIAFGLRIIRAIECELDEVFDRFKIIKRLSFMKDIPVVPFSDYYRQKLGYDFNWDALKADNAAGGSLCSETYKQLKKDLFADQVLPIIITDLPAGASPLVHKKNESILCRSYLVANKATLMEFAIGENDPNVLEFELSQQAKFQQNRYPRDDSAFLHAFRMGMPKVGSIFVGIDRILPAFLCIENINDLGMKM